MSQFRNNICEYFHPLSTLIYFLVLMTMAMVLTHPLYLLVLLITVISGIVVVDSLMKWRQTMVIALGMIFFLLFVNMLVSRSGQTVLWEIHLPFLGRLPISQESILFGLNMGLKLCLILSIFVFYEALMPAHKAFSLFSRFAPKSALTLILAALFVPQLRRRLSEVICVMKIRGAELNSRHYITRLRAQYPLLKVMLVSSLEDSWQTAESLHMRSFGLGKRTYFTRHNWQKRDTFILSCILFSFVGFVATLLAERGFLSFYPTVGSLTHRVDFCFVTWIILGLIVLPLAIVRERRT